MNNYKIEKAKKYSLNQLNGRLSNGKGIFIVLNEYSKKINYIIEIDFFRIDIIKEPYFNKKEYNKETYILTVEKYDSNYPGNKFGGCVIDDRLEFNSIQEAIDYLDKNYIKKEDWIIEDKK